MDPQTVVYTRDLGLAAFLLQVPIGRRARLVYESHGIASVVSEEQPRLLGRPDLVPSRAKLDRLERRDRRVWTHATAYVTITRALAEDLSDRFGARPGVFVAPDGAHPPPDGTDTASAPKPDASHTTRPLAAYAGHLYPWKGVDVLLEALALTPDVDGLVIGGHPQEADLTRVRALGARLGLTARVQFTEHQPASDVARHLARASMLVLPNTPSTISERYTSPLKLFEYLAMGRPIVASDTAAIREILTDEATALLVPPGDARALAAALSRVARDPALASRLGQRARDLAPAFTWDRRAARLDEALLHAARA